jgi:hypothetical protein
MNFGFTRKNFFAYQFLQTALVLVIILSLFIFQNQAIASTFGAATTYPTGTAPRNLASGDFNGDGDADFVVVNNSTNNITVKFGDGSGLITSTADFSVGTHPNDVAVGDFDNDLDLDLVVVNTDSNHVTKLLNNGNGSFSATPFPTLVGTGPSGIVAAHMNNDSNLDVVVTNTADDNVSVLLGDGTGEFSSKIDSGTVGTAPLGIVSGDFNLDSKTDIALVCDISGTMVVGFGNNDGTFTSFTSFGVGVNPHGIATGNFNGDARTDIAVTNYTGGTVSAFLGAPITFFELSQTVSVGANPQDLVIADFDADNNQDIVVTNYTDSNISLLSGNNDGTFDAADNYSAGSTPYGITKADLDTDGRQDVIVTNNGINVVSIIPNAPSGVLSYFSVIVSVNPAAGSPFPIATITARDGVGNTLTSFTGTVDISTNSGTITPTISGSFVNGVLANQLAITVTNVTSSSSDGTYGVGSIIPIQVVFSEIVTVVGTPQLSLATGNPVNTAIDYSSGSGSTTLVFNYTVASNNVSSDLEYQNTSALSLNGGTIQDGNGNDAQLTLPTLGAAGSLSLNKEIIIDTTAPVISETTRVATPSTDTTPNYTFTSDSAGTISYGGACSSSTTTAVAGANTVTFSALTAGTYSNCTIVVTDGLGMVSNTLTVSNFTIERSGGGGGGGIIIITPPPKCNDSSATNFGGSLPCVYPTIICSDSKAENFGATGMCTYKKTETLCTDTKATNFGGSLPCVYPVTTCSDSKAENFGATGMCTYKKTETLCTDTKATNVGGQLPCRYPDPIEECTGSSCRETCTGSDCGVITDTGDTGTGGGGDGGGDDGTTKTTVVSGGGFDCAFILSNDDPDAVDSILESARQSYCQTTKALQVSTKKIGDILSSPSADLVTKTVATGGVIAGTAVTVTTALFLNPISFSELLLIPVRLWSLLMTALGLKKRRRPWGVVYDSVTKQPLDPAYVTLRSSEGKDVASSLTDLDGRFGFVVPEPGSYALVAQKTNYTFPSQSLVGHDHDELYRDLYFGEYFTVATAGEIVIRNIPMDPEKFDWNEFAKKGQHLMKFYSSRNKILFLIADIFFGVGFVVASVAVVAAPKGYNIAVFILYTIVYFIKKYGVKTRTFGYIADKNTGLPLSFGIVRVSYASSGVEVIHRIADGTGKYYCLLPNGEYVVKIDRKMPDGTYQTVAENLPASVTNGYLAKTFEV